MELNKNGLGKHDDEDDPVVKEIPIFLSKRLEGQLYVFQYPLTPKSSTTEMNVRKCLIKPNNQEVKVEVDVNTHSANFDTSKAEDIALEVDGLPETRKPDNKVVFENNIMDKLLYKSAKAVKDNNKYAIGVYNGKELHLTALEGILKLRPCFPHLERASKRKQEGKQDVLNDEEKAGPSSAQQVTVRFARNESEQLKKIRESSYRRLKEKSEQEPWVPCKWHSMKSPATQLQKQKLYAENLEMVAQDMNLTAEEYIRVIVPEDQQQAIVQPKLPCNVMSLHALRALPLLEQCRLLLKDAKIIPFQQLMMLLAGGEGSTSETLLRTLPQVAVLVQGNWVVKSEVLYPANTFSATSGVPADVMCRARDYVLHLFTKTQYVERRKVSSVIKIPNEEIKEIFTGISKLRYNKGWELALPADTEFINKHPEISQRQNMVWEQRAKQLSEFLAEGKEKTKQRRKSKSVSEDAQKTAKKDVAGVSKDGLSSDNDSGTERSKKPSPAVRKRKKTITDASL